jgi:HNH endonuclease
VDILCPHCDQATPHRIEKYCPKCDATLPHVSFSPNKAHKDGLCSWCKACRNAHNKTPAERAKLNAYMRTWNGGHRDIINPKAVEAYYALKERRTTDPALNEHCLQLQRAKNKRFRTLHPERVRAATDAWRTRNPERAMTTRRAYLQRNRPYILAKQRERYARDPEANLVHTRMRRARKKHAPINDLTAAQWKAIKHAYHFRCVYCPPTCAQCARKTHTLTQEHLTPLSQGGSHTVANVVPACRSCNSRRNNRAILKPVQPVLLLWFY